MSPDALMVVQQVASVEYAHAVLISVQQQPPSVPAHICKVAYCHLLMAIPSAVQCQIVGLLLNQKHFITSHDRIWPCEQYFIFFWSTQWWIVSVERNMDEAWTSTEQLNYVRWAVEGFSVSINFWELNWSSFFWFHGSKCGSHSC